MAWICLGLFAAPALAQKVTPPELFPRFVLRAGQTWQLNSPQAERFDASGLLLTPDLGLLTVNDRGPGIYQIRFNGSTHEADLIPLTNCLTPAQLAPFAKEKVDRYDCEGIARDDQGRLYVCEEANRWILRFDPRTSHLERLSIDWSPVQKYFHQTDRNASFEGVAIANGKLYVANERQLGRIIVVDLKSLKVERNFSVRPGASQARDIHYSDLSWSDGSLFVLLRESRVILKIDPDTERVLAEYSFAEMERQLEVVYKSRYPTSTMEGLAVDRDFFWLITDNNGEARWKYPNDKRPSLFKCPRPDKPITTTHQP